MLDLEAGIGRCGRQAGQGQRAQVVDIVAHETDLSHLEVMCGGEGAQGSSLVFASLVDVADAHLGSIAIDQRAVLAGDQRETNASLERERDAHHVGEAEAQIGRASCRERVYVLV